MNKELAESIRKHFNDVLEKKNEHHFETYNTLLAYIEELPEGLGKVALRLYFENKKAAVGGNGEVTEMFMNSDKAKAWLIFEEYYDANIRAKKKTKSRNRSSQTSRAKPTGSSIKIKTIPTTIGEGGAG